MTLLQKHKDWESILRNLAGENSPAAKGPTSMTDTVNGNVSKKKKKETSTTAAGCLHYATLQLMRRVLPFLSADALSRTRILTETS